MACRWSTTTAAPWRGPTPCYASQQYVDGHFSFYSFLYLLMVYEWTIVDLIPEYLLLRQTIRNAALTLDCRHNHLSAMLVRGMSARLPWPLSGPV